MSLATLYALPSTAHPFPRRAQAAHPGLIRWGLRSMTVVIFTAATAAGLALGLSAPSSSPASVVPDSAPMTVSRT